MKHQLFRVSRPDDVGAWPSGGLQLALSKHAAYEEETVAEIAAETVEELVHDLADLHMKPDIAELVISKRLAEAGIEVGK